MDEINIRVLSIMDGKQLTKSGFASLLEISLPMLTHISTGRNKPGLELIQKILIKFPEINPDWLILGVGTMKRSAVEKPNFNGIIAEIELIKDCLVAIEQRTEQVLAYHKIVHREISYLNDLDQLLIENQSITSDLKIKLAAINKNIEFKLRD